MRSYESDALSIPTQSSPAASTDEMARARQLVLSYGWNNTSYQILNPGIQHWFSPTTAAVVGFTRRQGSLLVAGAPVCPPEALWHVCTEFEARARKQGRSVCYVCAEERLRTLFAGSPNHAAIALGAQPVWDPRTWSGIVQRRPSLRAQLNRSRNKGVHVEEITPEEAAGNPELRRVVKEWLDTRRLPPLHFLVEPNVLDGVVTDRIIFAASVQGRPVAVLVASPVAAKEGYLVELLARSSAAPNGATELLIDTAMRRFADENRHMVTLGLVALSDLAGEPMRHNPLWLRGMMRFARLHANRFYNFRGLEQFRLKLAPEKWEPVYAISNERRFSVRTLYSLGSAFSGISPVLALATGAVKAIREEAARLLGAAI